MLNFRDPDRRCSVRVCNTCNTYTHHVSDKHINALKASTNIHVQLLGLGVPSERSLFLAFFVAA